MSDPGAVAPAHRTGYLGWRVRERPRPSFAHVLGAPAGAFAVIAMVAFVVAIDENDPQVAGTALSAVLLVVALVAGAFGPGPVRSAAVTAIVPTVPLLWLFTLVGDGNGGRSDIRGVLLLSLLGYVVLYLLTWTRGRNILLALALIVFVVWLAFEIGGDGGSSSFGTAPQVEGPFSFDEPTTNDALNTGTDTGATAAVMIAGLVFLVAGGLLDRRRMEGMATPLLAVGAVAAIVGGIGLAGDESALAASIVAVLIGAAVGIIGAAGRERRGTTWLGVLTVFGGLVGILVDIAPDDAAGVGAIALGFAVVIALVAWGLARLLREPDDGDEVPRVPPSPAPVGAGDHEPPATGPEAEPTTRWAPEPAAAAAPAAEPVTEPAPVTPAPAPVTPPPAPVTPPAEPVTQPAEPVTQPGEPVTPPDEPATEPASE